MTTETILLIFLAVVIASFISYFQYYFRAKKRTRETAFLASLRGLSVLTLLILLINPKIKTLQLVEEKPILNVAVDNSTSIRYAKAESQINSSIQQLRADQELNAKYTLNYYSFADELTALDTLKFDISQTNIINALQGLNEINRDKIAPIVVLTDGNQTQGNDYRYYASKQPIYPVVVGDTMRYEDLKITQLNVNAYASLEHKFPVEVFVQYEGYSNVTKQFTIRQGNQTVYSTMLRFSPEENAQQVQVNLPANSIGLKHYVASISALENEKNTINNRRNFSVEVIDEQAKILLLTSIKHPDVGMLKRSIETNKLIKVEVEEDLTKELNLRGYQLVILYQPNAKFKKILADIEAEKSNVFFISGVQTDWAFLNQNQPYFTKNSLSSSEEYGADFNADFDEFIVDDIGFSSFAPLQSSFGQINFKQAAKSLLFQRIENFSTDEPLLSTFTMGERRGAILFGEGIWKWRMLTQIEQKSPVGFDEFMHKIIQYLSSTKRASRLELSYDPLTYSNGILQFNAQYYDANYVFDPSGELRITLTHQEDDKKQTIPFALKNNTFELKLSDLAPGTYNFTVNVVNQNIQKSGFFRVLDYDIEQQMTSSNYRGLAQLAGASKGATYSSDQVSVLISNLLNDSQYKTIQRSKETIKSLIEIRWLLAILVVLLALEWLVRKYRGLI